MALHDGLAPPRTDAAIALAAGLAVAVDATTSQAAAGPAWANVALCLAIGAPLAWRRRAPVLATAAALGIATLQTAVLTPLPPLVTPLIVLLLSAYAIAAHAPLRRALAGAAVGVAGGTALQLATPSAHRAPSGVLPTAAVLAAVWVAGRAVRDRSLRLRRLEELDARLLQARRERERLAVAEERAHVARELHDVVAYAMTVICVQAGAARRVWADQPDDARRALLTVGSVARDTLTHLRDALNLLDPQAPEACLELADLEALAVGARAAGLEVEVAVDGRPHPLPGAIGLVAYRVVQEALTNAARHAAPTDVAVRLAYRPGAVVIEVHDAGRRPGAAPAAIVEGSGHGLRGMRERVEACAGALAFGSRADGGFGVSAHLPLVSPP